MYRREAVRAKAEEHLTAALSLCLDMNLGLWLERSAAELKELGNLFVVAAHNPKLYDFLKQEFPEAGPIQVILDRRRRQQREALQAREAIWGGPERRRRTRISEDLRSHGLAVVPKEMERSLAA
jgi:hypothetical protein